MALRTARKALEKFIGLGSALRRAAMRSTFCCLRLPISLAQAAWRLICPGFSVALTAAKTDLMSPTIGAAIARLLSNSVGEMSTWTNRVLSDHSGALPCDKSQFR